MQVHLLYVVRLLLHQIYRANNEHKEEKSEGQGMFILGSKGYKGALKDKTH